MERCLCISQQLAAWLVIVLPCVLHLQIKFENKVGNNARHLLHLLPITFWSLYLRITLFEFQCREQNSWDDLFKILTCGRNSLVADHLMTLGCCNEKVALKNYLLSNCFSRPLVFTARKRCICLWKMVRWRSIWVLIYS